MYQKKIRFIFGFVTVVFLLTIFLSGCKSAEMQAIENSAAVLQITTGREVNKWTHDKGVTLGKPVDAKIFIVYEPINNHTRKDVYEEIVAILKKNNWVGSEPITAYDYFEATLQQGSFEISTGVSIDENKNIVTISMAIH